MASSAPNGSSISSTSASCDSARASATRWRIPPDSSCGRFLANSLRCTSSSSSSTRTLRSSFGTLRSLSARSMLPRAVSHGNSAASWNISVVRPFDLDGPGRGAVEAGEDVEQRALPAPGRAEQAHELARRDVERHAVEGVHGVAGVSVDLRDGVEDDGGRWTGRGGAGLGRGDLRGRLQVAFGFTPAMVGWVHFAADVVVGLAVRAWSWLPSIGRRDLHFLHRDLGLARLLQDGVERLEVVDLKELLRRLEEPDRRRRPSPTAAASAAGGRG